MKETKKNELPKHFEILERLLINDYHNRTMDNYDKLFSELITKQCVTDFTKHYTPLKIFQRFTKEYKFEPDWVVNYLNKDYKFLYNIYCKN